MRVPTGHAGSWFAEWDGDSLPCIHSHALRNGGKLYVDDGVNAHPAWPRFIAALSEKRVAILTTSHPPDENGIRRRSRYIGIWEIGEVTVEQPVGDEMGILSFPMGNLKYRFKT